MNQQSEQSQYEGLKNEMQVIEKAVNALFYASFPGSLAQDVAISQMYLQGLAKRLKAEIDRLAPANEPLTKNVMEGKPVVVGAPSVGHDS